MTPFAPFLPCPRGFSFRVRQSPARAFMSAPMQAIRALLLTGAAAVGAALNAQTYTFSTAATPGSASAVVVDAAGNYYVGTGTNHTLLKFSPSGVSQLLAGQSYFPGATDGTGAGAQFNNIRGLALDAAGNLYACEYGHTIRKITPAGVVTTVVVPVEAWPPAVVPVMFCGVVLTDVQDASSEVLTQL